jgi:hypothetical protein
MSNKGYRSNEQMLQDAQIAQALQIFVERMAAGVCPECQQKIEKEKQVGRCVYAEPCGHRLGQGRAKKTYPKEPEF